MSASSHGPLKWEEDLTKLPGRGSRWTRVGVVLVFLLALFPRASVRAETPPRIIDPLVEYTFGEQLTFRARIEPSEGVEEVWIFLRIQGQPNTLKAKAQVNPRGQVSLTIDYDGSIGEPNALPPLPAFAWVHYWYHVTWQNGEQYTMDASLPFYHEDNRYPWRTLESEHFTMHWYDGDMLFAQEIADTAEAGLGKIATMLLSQGEMDPGLEPNPADKTRIYVYPQAVELQSVLRQGGPAWVAGHASPQFNVLLVSLDPRKPEIRLEIERQVPHELAHIILYQYTGSNYQNIPTWLNEGIASVSELYPNPDYELLLDAAYQQDKSLIRLADLCHGFPTDTSRALLAYAQATSFTRYLVDHYGNSGLQALVREYADGKSCAVGTQTAFGETLDDLEQLWRQSEFAENPWLTALTSLLPWLGLLGAFTVPLILSSLIGKRGKKHGETASQTPGTQQNGSRPAHKAPRSEVKSRESF